MTKMTNDAPTAWDMLTHEENQTVPKKPAVPYGFVLNPEKAQALRREEYEKQKHGHVQYVLPIFERK